MPQQVSAPAGPGAAAGRRTGKLRARQRLIDACISALHIHGPSRTTVSRVVALAGLSPGIVRFYFNSKAAMLVAALEYLAAEFGERVLKPVAALRHSPVAALGLLVELYLDAGGVALGLIGVLEVLWQGIAFQSEANIDRRALVARALAYLRSVFPGQFPGLGRERPRPAAAGRRRHRR